MVDFRLIISPETDDDATILLKKHHYHKSTPTPSEAGPITKIYFRIMFFINLKLFVVCLAFHNYLWFKIDLYYIRIYPIYNLYIS